MSVNDADERPATSSDEPQRLIDRRFLVLFGFLNFGFYLTVLMPALFSLPYKVQELDPDSKALNLGIVAASGAIVSMLAGPAAGVLSDRTRSRWGRRPPWMLGGLAVAVAGVVIIGAAPTLLLTIAGWLIVCLGGAGVGAGVIPVVAEQVPERQRGTAGAIVGVATQLAGVLGYVLGGLLTSSMFLVFGVPYVVLGVAVLLWVWLIPDSSVELPRTPLSQTFRLMAFDPRQQPDFGFLWLGKLSMQIALAFVTTYQLYFLGDRLGFTAEEAGQKLALVGGIGIVVTMSFAVVSGLWSDRLKRRKSFIATSGVLTAIGLVLLSVTNGFGLFVAAVMFILGAAGMFGSVDVAMASDLVPERDQAGRWMTIYNLAGTLPTAIAPVLGSLLLMIGSADGTNYTTLYIAGAGFAIGTIATTYAIRGVR